MLDVHARLIRRLEQVARPRPRDRVPARARRRSPSARPPSGASISPELAVVMAYCKICAVRASCSSPTCPRTRTSPTTSSATSRAPLPGALRGDADCASHRLRREIIATRRRQPARRPRRDDVRVPARRGDRAPRRDARARLRGRARGVRDARLLGRGRGARQPGRRAASQLGDADRGAPAASSARPAGWCARTPRPIDIAATIAALRARRGALAAALPGVLDERRPRGVRRSAPSELEQRRRPARARPRGRAAMPSLLSAFDIVEVAAATGRRSETVIGDLLPPRRRGSSCDWLRDRILELPRANRWQALARAALRDDLYALHRALTHEMLADRRPRRRRRRGDRRLVASATPRRSSAAWRCSPTSSASRTYDTDDAAGRAARGAQPRSRSRAARRARVALSSAPRDPRAARSATGDRERCRSTPASRNATGPVTARPATARAQAQAIVCVMATVKTNVTELPESRVRVEAEVPPRRSSAASSRRRRQLGRADAGPRVPQGQGPAAGRDPPARPRGGARRGAAHARSAAGTSTRSTRPGSRRSASPSSTSATCPSQGEPLAFSIEIGVRPRGQARRVQGPRGRPPRAAGRRTRRSTRSSSALRERFGDARDRRAPGGDRRPRRGRLRRHGRRRAVRGRRGPRPAARARLRPADPGLRGAARRAPARARSGRRASPSPSEYAERARRAGRDVRRHRQRGQGQAPARARRRVRVRGRRVRHARRAARGHRRAAARGRRARDRARVRGGRARRRRRRGRRSRCPSSSFTRARTRCSSRRSRRSARQGISQRDATCRSPARTRRRSPHEAEPEAAQALRREAVLAAIVEAEQIEPTDEELMRGARRRPPSATAPIRPRCSSSCARTGASTSSARTSPTRQALELLVREAKPISVEQAKAREKLWTPGKDRRGRREAALGPAVDPGQLSAAADGSSPPGRPNRRLHDCYIRQESGRGSERSEDHEPTGTDGR